MKKATCWLAAIVAAHTLSLPASRAQTQSATISGTVLDGSGASVASARVEAESLETGATRTITTTDAGVYSLAALSVGHYKVTIHAVGFQEYEWRDVQLQVRENLTLDARLSVSTTSTTVDVA